MTLSLNSWNLRNSRVCGKSSTQGALTGVGLSIGYPLALNGSPTGLSVMSAVPGGHAEKAGIVSGDVILAIDNKSAQDMDIYDAADRLQGPEGSSIDSDMLRERYTLNPVRSRMCEILGSEDSSKIGYIKLTTFNQNAAGSVKEAIKKLRENNVKAFVLDLQNNSGGLFPEGIEIAKIWMDKGVIVCICDSRGVRYIYEADGASMIAASEPLVILVLQRNCKRKRDPCRSTERQQKSSGVWGTNIWKRQQSLTSGGRLMQQ